MRASTPSIHRRTRDQHIVHHGKDALAADPQPTLIPNGTVVQHSSLVESHTAAMNAPRERQFLGVEVIPAGAIQHLVWLVA